MKIHPTHSRRAPRALPVLTLLGALGACATPQGHMGLGGSAATAPAKSPLTAGLGLGTAAPPPAPAPTLSTAGHRDDEHAALDPIEDDNAAHWLRRGFELTRANQDLAAAHAFRAALGTNNLNDAGRAVAYWHLYLSEQAIGHTDAATEALMAFVVLAEDIIDIRGSLRYGEEGEEDFVDRFELPRRLARGRAILLATWASRSQRFGRSQAQPVPVHSSAERDYFLELAPPCGRESSLGEAARRAPHYGEVQHVDLQCSGRSPTRYYFELVRDD